MDTKTKELFQIARQKLGLSQKAFSEVAGISHAMVASVETGRCRLSKKLAWKISVRIGMSIYKGSFESCTADSIAEEASEEAASKTRVEILKELKPLKRFNKSDFIFTSLPLSEFQEGEPGESKPQIRKRIKKWLFDRGVSAGDIIVRRVLLELVIKRHVTKYDQSFFG